MCFILNFNGWIPRYSGVRVEQLLLSLGIVGQKGKLAQRVSSRLPVFTIMKHGAMDDFL